MAKEHKRITLGLVLSWIFGVLFGISGLSFLFTGSIIGGGSLILASLILLPPVNKFSKERFNFELSAGLKLTLVIVLFIIYAVSLSTSDTSSLDTSSNQQPSGTESGSGINTGNSEPETTTPAVEEQSDKSTLGERNALKSAQSYLKYSGFSEKGLKDQLAYESYTSSEINYAIDNVVVDWNEEAHESAESYLKYSSFSKQELHDQLAYEGFTESQIQYALEQVGY